MKIAVVYDGAAEASADGSRSAVPDTAGVLEAVEGVAQALDQLGHHVKRVRALPPVGRVLSELRGVDLVFNLAESLDGAAEGEPRIAALFELAGVPVTGAPSDVLALCRRKDLVNAVLSAADLPVPPWALAEGSDAGAWSDFPAIVKPAGEDGSVGIHETSVVEDPVELAAALRRMDGTPAMIQRFVAGRELNVGIVGDIVLPVAEIEFAGAQRIVSYAAKWQAGSGADLATRPVCPARIPESMRVEATAVALAAWRRVGARGYGRVDLRADRAGRIHVLEVNPNADLAPDAGLARMAAAASWSYATLVDRIVREAR